MQTQLLKIALTTALFAGAAHAVTLNDAKVAFRAGNWKVLRIIDPMTDKINCAGIYKDDNSIQLSADNLIIGVQGGVGLVTLRYGDEPAKDFRLAQDMERRLRAVIISGTDFQELAGSKRLRYSVLTALDNSVSGDLNLEGFEAALSNIRSGCPIQEVDSAQQKSDSVGASACNEDLVARMRTQGIKEDQIQAICR